MNTDYKAALQNVRRMLDRGFYNTDYIIRWIDGVLDNKQSPHNRMTPEVQKQLEVLLRDSD